LWYKNTTKPNGVNSFFGLKRDRSWFGNSTVAPTLPLEKIPVNSHRLDAARIIRVGDGQLERRITKPKSSHRNPAFLIQLMTDATDLRFG
jgi:hypothetical protein